MKNIITFVCAALAAVLFVACNKNNSGSDSPKQEDNTPVSYKYSFTVGVADGATDHQTVLNTVVSAPDEKGNVKEYALPDNQKSLTVTNTVPLSSVPFSGEMVLKATAKPGVELTKDNYLVGLSYNVIVESYNAAGEMLNQKKVDGESGKGSVKKEKMAIYTYTHKFVFTVDAHGAVTLNPKQEQ